MLLRKRLLEAVTVILIDDIFSGQTLSGLFSLVLYVLGGRQHGEGASVGLWRVALLRLNVKVGIIPVFSVRHLFKITLLVLALLLLLFLAGFQFNIR